MIYLRNKNKSSKIIIITGVAELVDALGLGSSDLCRESSSLSIRIHFIKNC